MQTLNRHAATVCNRCMKRLEHETLTVTKSLSEIYLVMSQGRKNDDTDERMVMVILSKTDLIHFLASRDTQDEMISKSLRVLTPLPLCYLRGQRNQGCLVL